MTVIALTKIGFLIAQKILQPILVDSQKEIFAKADFVIKNDGWTEGQLPHKDTYKNPESYTEKNFDDARKHIVQIENLLDITNNNSTLEQRIETLSFYFKRTEET